MPDQTTSRDYDTGTCRGCGGTYTLTKFGWIRAHNRDYEPCSGSRKPPVDV